MLSTEAIERMLVLFAEDTQSIHESCTRTDGTFPHPEDREEYEMRVDIQHQVTEALSDYRRIHCL